MRKVTLLIVVGLVLCVQGKVLADTWCNSAYPPDPASCHSAAIYCDDMDRSICNCDPACPPPPPMPCTDTCWTWPLCRQYYPRTSAINDNPDCLLNPAGSDCCGVEHKGDEDSTMFTSMPLALRNPNGDLGQATVDLTGDIEYTFGEGVETVNGTDANPLVLRFDMSGGVPNNCHVHWDIGTFELFFDDGTGNNSTRRAPMDYILVGDPGLNPEDPDCKSCKKYCMNQGIPNSGVPAPWPHVCQSYEARPECPPLQTNTRKAIAVGCNAILDPDPCHCDTPDAQKPVNYYLSFYDGLKWRIIHPGHLGPDGEGELEWTTTDPYARYFALGCKYNTITMTVRTHTVDFSIRRKLDVDGDWQWHTDTVTGIKRIYEGEFNGLHSGSSIGCELDDTSYSCTGNRHCLHTGYDRCDGGGKSYWGHRYLELDGLGLSGGVPGGIVTGACCYDNGACAGDVTSDYCENTLNGRYDGNGSQCGDVLCCPDPFADADKDDDVDQEDFGMWQACFSGDGNAHPGGDVCECFDRDDGDGSRGGDNDVDGTDFDWFTDCWSGPSVPSDTTCDGVPID